MLKRILSSIVLVLILAFAAFGQNLPPNQAQRFDGPQPNDERPNLIAELGLSKEQIQLFRRTNGDHRPLMQAAQQRFREANRDLDIAIYADVVSEESIRGRLRDFQEAQSEVNRLRFMNELAIRKILTPDQVMRFREMRRRFAETRELNNRRQRRIQRNEDRPINQNPPRHQNQDLRPANKQNRPMI